MDEQLIEEIEAVRKQLTARLLEIKDKQAILRSAELRSLFDRIPQLPPDQRASFGRVVNELRDELAEIAEAANDELSVLPPIDTTAPFATNVKADKRPGLLPADWGSTHPLMSELKSILDIFISMGFSIVESREIDDDWHMFGALNFPEGHPARDDYDTFMTVQKDKSGKPWIAPAHTSTMQNRALKQYKTNLDKDEPIAVVIPGRVFRNEDVDARHEHTFYQLEGVYVAHNVSIGNLIATLKTFLESYYRTTIDVRTQPFYFPFTEPSLEFAMSCPFCKKHGCRICSQSGWIELIGCGQIHPNVLRAADIDPEKYQGFAWGGGIERLVMMRHNIEDVRLFESGRLDFLRQFSASKGDER